MKRGVPLPGEQVQDLRSALLTLLLLLACSSVYAFKGAAGIRVELDPSSLVHSDLYLLGWNVTVDGEVDGDLIVLGGTVRVHGPVHGTVYLAGGSVEIDGPVDGDVNLLSFVAESKAVCRACRILALDLEQRGVTAGDMLGFGAFIADSQGKIGGDTLLGGEDVTLGGEHVGRFYGVGHQVTIAGSVDGDARIKADSVVLAQSGRVKGDLVYVSPRDLTGDPGRISGTVSHRFPPPYLAGKYHVPWVYMVSHKLLSALWLTVVGLVSLTWFPRSSQSVVDTMLHHPWESFGVGLLIFVAMPGIAFMLLVSFLGIPLGIFLFGLFGIGIYLTRLFASLYIGQRLLGAMEHHRPPHWQSLPLGVFLFTVFTSIPLVGMVFSFVTIPQALGAKALLSWRLYRKMRKRHTA